MGKLRGEERREKEERWRRKYRQIGRDESEE